MTHHLLKNSVLDRKDVKAAAGLLGIYALTKLTTKALYVAWNFLKPRKDLVKRYGSDSWVVVTGATSGIGEAFCDEFAALGFNIVLVSRSEEKLKATKANLENKYASNSLNGQKRVEFRTVVADFAKSLEEGFFEKIWKELKDLDISILINNAGQSTNYPKASQKVICDMMIVNEMPVVMMTRMFIEGLQKRNERSLVVNISSEGIKSPIPSIAAYCGTKAFVDYFTQSIASQYKHKVDFISFVVGSVSTNMNITKVGEHNTISAKDCVQGLFNEIGYKLQTSGHWRHQIENYIGPYLKFSDETRVSQWLEEEIQKQEG